MIKKVLVANRGEIAVRIIRTCKEMNIQTVAIYSTAYKDSLHVMLADEAICVGPPSSTESYLNMNNILEAALSTGCDAIHPGVGFLSENAQFASLVEECNLIFIGPSSSIIEAMGDKIRAKELMIEANISVIPGSQGEIKTIQEVNKYANKIGYPLIIKACAGGGGRGMRIVRNHEELANAFQSAKAESKAAFGNDALYVEKLFENTKHIEVQIVADKHNNIIHLYERDCSFQRRHQKMIEESPCHSLSERTRQNIINDALKASHYVKYDNVGTIEFLVDSNGQHYFLEMNTRIQVEHPITEMITGIDLIKCQILSASGRELLYTQEDITVNGHAIECRINAEDIQKGFISSPGKVEFVHFPGGRNIRIDTAIYTKTEISPYYDSMIAKLIVFGKTRLEAIKKMRLALEEMIVDALAHATCPPKMSPLSLPIGIVPISLTNLVIFLSCYVVGMKRTVLCVFLYLLIGLAGFPVFSGFSGGLTKLLGPTGGYLFGFIFMAWIAGYFIEKHLRYQLIGMILGASICSLIGTFWLSFVTNLSLTTAIGLGVTPFIVGDLIKILIAMFIGPKLKRIEFR